MTSFGRLLVTLWQEKNRTMYQMTGFGLIALVVFTIYGLFNGGSLSIMSHISMVVFMLLTIVLFILLARDQEHVWTSNKYRLIPVSDTKLYLANVLATVLTFVYFYILELVIMVICDISEISSLTNIGNGYWPQLLSGQLLMLAFLLFGWVFISTIHFVIVSVSAFLPAFRQRLIRVVLAIVIFIVVVNIVNCLQKLMSQILSNMFSSSLLGVSASTQLTTALLLGTLYFVISTVVLSALNVYLMKRWVETSTKAA